MRRALEAAAAQMRLRNYGKRFRKARAFRDPVKRAAALRRFWESVRVDQEIAQTGGNHWARDAAQKAAAKAEAKAEAIGARLLFAVSELEIL